MTLAERAQLATKARQDARDAKARQLNALCASGMNLKRAAHAVGWSYRSARRWKNK